MIDVTWHLNGGGQVLSRGLMVTEREIKELMKTGEVFGINVPNGTMIINPANIALSHVHREYDEADLDEDEPTPEEDA